MVAGLTNFGDFVSARIHAEGYKLLLAPDCSSKRIAGVNAALALIGFDPELATLAQLQESTVPRTFGLHSRRSNNDACL
jgi:hypothetical protein